MHPATVSIASGGLLFRALRRAGATTQDTVRPGRSILVLVLVTWVPLAVFSALEGTLWGGGVEVPFLRDPSVHARLLVALPLLVIGEALISRTAQGAITLIRERQLLAESELPALDARVEQVVRERDSWPVELLILALTAALLWFARDTLRAERVLPHTSWLGVPGGAGALSRAGWWYFVMSAFVSNVFALRWIWWLFIWTRFLLGFLRPRLLVNPGHPDQHGGLAFLTLVQSAFAPVFAALAATMSGRLWYEMLYDGATLKGVEAPIVVVLALAVLVMFLPLLLFPARTSEPLLGNADPSTLADFATAYTAVRQMKPVALDVRRALPAILLVAAPFLPLLLTVMSLKDILSRALKLLM